MRMTSDPWFSVLLTVLGVACSDSSIKTGSTAQPTPTPTVEGDAGPAEDLSGEIAETRTLTAGKSYILKGIVFVRSGVTLTIPKGTTIRGELGTKGTLVVQPGAKLMAEGTAEEPIVFTSSAPDGSKKAGDWGGIVMLGNAPVNYRDANGGAVRGAVEGITSGGEFGGSDENDSSGALKYVRIEYAGVQLSPDNEINGLTFAGVGRGTVVDYVQVRHALDDCFEFFGGTVNAKHLACQYNQDDGFDWDNGYRGKLQFLVLQQDPDLADDTNGFEGDNDAKGTTNGPVSEPTIYNATLCGKNKDVPKQQYGMLLRRNTKGHIFNTLVLGFEAGIDLRDKTTKANATENGLEIRASIFFGSTGTSGMLAQGGFAYTENGAQQDKAALDYDDDDGLDEAAWLGTAGNHAMDPGIPGCFDAANPKFGPAASITAGAAAPPNDGFLDAAASYVGAFKDANDTWATSGKWAVWSAK